MEDICRMKPLRKVAAALAIGMGSLWAPQVLAQSPYLLGWGLNGDGQASPVPTNAMEDVDAFSAGEWHALALKGGQVVAWGSNTFGQCDVPSALSNGVDEISAGGTYSMALKGGAVHVFGIGTNSSYEYGIRSVPADASNGVTAIAAGTYHALALKEGRVIAWGAPFYDATEVPAEASNGVVAITAGDQVSAALKGDGTVVLWGSVGPAEEFGFGLKPVPAFGSNGVAQIDAGRGHLLARCATLPPRFMGSSLPYGYTGGAYAGSVTATGNPAVAYAKSAGPAWLTVGAASGAVGGTPTTNGTFGFSVVASNAVGRATNSYSITIFAEMPQAPVFITVGPLPTGQVGQAYSTQILASNNPTFTLDPINPLPPGLTLSTNGLLSGTPTQEYSTKFLRIVASNIAGSVSRDFMITVLPPDEPPVFVTESPLANGVVGSSYTVQLEASNSPTFSVVSGSLPLGLGMGTGGLISGVPQTIETATFTVRASNTGGTADREFQIRVFGPPVFTTTSPLATGEVGVAYAQQLDATGSPTYGLQSGTLPAGLSLHWSGAITGIPSAMGTATFTAYATNAYGWTSREFSLTVRQIPAFTTTNPLPNGRLTNAYTIYMQATGSPTYTNVAGALPAGMRLLGTGRLFGVPSETGAFNFTVRATNVYGYRDQAYDLTIEGGGVYLPPSFTLARATNGNVRLAWTNPNASGGIAVWRATNLAGTPVVWSNLGVQVSPYTNEAPPAPAYYQLRIVP